MTDIVLGFVLTIMMMLVIFIIYAFQEVHDLQKEIKLMEEMMYKGKKPKVTLKKVTFGKTLEEIKKEEDDLK